MRSFIERIPKVELHLHIEGTLEPDLLFDLAQRNNVDLPFSSVSEVRQAYEFSNLQDFLDIYYQGMGVLQTRRDFFELTYAYLRKVANQNVMHTEIFFDPQGHTDRGVAFSDVIDGITDGLEKGEKDFGISSAVIMCFLRHLSEESALETFEQALQHKSKIVGVGLDSSEVGNPPEKFATVFNNAAEAGFLAVAHAGEEGPPSYVVEALDVLKVNRIDHGNRALEDAGLVARLVEERVPLTVCPLSNLKLHVVDDLYSHPLKKMLNLGVKATVNSDDPSYFGGYINENLVQVAAALNLDKRDIIQLVENSISASFADKNRKAEMAASLETFLNQMQDGF